MSGWKLHGFGVAALGWEEWGRAPLGWGGGGSWGAGCPRERWGMLGVRMGSWGCRGSIGVGDAKWGTAPYREIRAKHRPPSTGAELDEPSIAPGAAQPNPAGNTGELNRCGDSAPPAWQPLRQSQTASKRNTSPPRPGVFTAIVYSCGIIPLKAPGDHRAGPALRVKFSVCFASCIHLHAMGL